MDEKIAIHSTGLVTALGPDVATTWDALLAGRCIRDHARAALDPDANLPRVSQLALRAARQALERQPRGEDCALVVGTSKGPVEQWLLPDAFTPSSNGRTNRLSSSMSESTPAPPPVPGGVSRASLPSAATSGTPAQLTAPSLAQVSDDLARALRISGPRLTLSSACASGLHALIRGAMLIASGEARRVLVVAAEASVHPLFLGSFRRLGVLPPEGVGCRPFDRDRAGFLMSEAAAAVLLGAGEPDHDAGHVALDRFALAADATSLTGSDPDAAALRHALRRVVADRDLDLVHAHGTGTVVNDAIELAAIDAECARGGSRPLLYSHKAALGHSLGAAGLVSVVINIQCHRHGIVPPNAHTRHPLPTQAVQLHAATTLRPIHHSVALAAGFGGPIAVVGLRSNA